jgi:hypothetical protein
MHLDSTNEGSSDSPTHLDTIVDNPDKKHPSAYFESGPSDETSRLLGQGSSGQSLEMVPGYEEMDGGLPPEFHPYHADYETTSSGDIYSHDQHLNEDGECAKP